MRFPFKLLLAGLALLILYLQSHAQVAFAPATNYFVGSSPLSVTTADVNGDGKVDLVTAISGNNTLSVLTNNGLGKFGSNTTFFCGWEPHSVAAADVNGDGKVDLISANTGFSNAYISNSVTAFTNNGSGGFILSATLHAGIYRPYSIATADVNGDGAVDLICANARIGNGNQLGSDTIAILTNNRVGSFALAASIHVGSDPLFVVTADVNGDGWVDVISENWLGNTLSILTNNGSGGFAIASSPSAGSQPFSIAAADINGDNWIDLICGHSGNTLSILTNNGSGGFVLASSPQVGNGGASGVTAADVNLDGKMDLICQNFNDFAVMVLTNNGSGSFVLVATCPVLPFPEGIAAADVNDDGRVDVISANSLGDTLSVLINAPTLGINFSSNSVLVSWPSSWTNWMLLQNSDLRTTNWISSTGIADDGTNKILTLAPTMGNLFFRLLHP